MIIETPYPVSTNRYYRKVNNRMIISNEGVLFKNTVHYLNFKIKPQPANINVGLEIIIHPKLTKKNLASKQLIDLDNGLKCILDSLIGIVYVDDKQVKEIKIKYGKPIFNGGASILFSLWRDDL